MWLLRLFLALYAAVVLLPLCSAAFVETYKLEGISTANYLLNTFIIDVALDVDNKLLKFFINSKVYDSINTSTIDPVITDVNPFTNRYTTFHVDIDFMGKTFIERDLRFCEMVAVKNTSATDHSVRFSGALDASSSSSADTFATYVPEQPMADLNSTSVAKRNINLLQFLNASLSDFGLMASNNDTIDHIFSNSTGHLISCPLYQNDSIAMYFQADVSDHYNRLGSYTVRLTVISNGEESYVIGGARAYVTPVLQPLAVTRALFWGVLSLLLVTKCINIFITVFSPDQESSNPFLTEASTICNESLLKQLEPTPTRIVHYFQYALFLSALNLQYPGFLQPFMGQIRWCALLGIDLLKSQISIPLLESDNIYITLNATGLSSLVLFSSSFIYYIWPNFMLCLLGYIGINLVIYQSFIMFRLFTASFKKNHPRLMRSLPKVATIASKNNEEIFRYSLSKNAWALVGHFLRQLLSTFGMPFLVLTFFMLYNSNNMSETKIWFSQGGLRVNAFNYTSSYDTLVSPPIPASSLNGTSDNAIPNSGLHSIPLGSIIAGCVSLVAWIAISSFFIFRYLVTFNGWKVGVNPNVRKLYTSVKAVIMWSYFYNEYQPDKVPYSVVELVYTILLLIIVGLVQKLGTVQVVLLIVLEFLQLSILITVKPFFLKMRWYSLCWIIPTARFIVITLCIPYIRPLNVSEASRTYVAYVQMVVHLLVAFMFVGHLFYSLALTATSYFKVVRERKRMTILAGAKGASTDDFNNGFEYLPVAIRQGETSSKVEVDPLTPRSTGAEEGGEMDYYRTKTEKILQRSQQLQALTAMNLDSAWDDEMTSEEFDFDRTEERKKQKDYTTREGDRLYEKFFSGGVVDPEIRDLWLSRDWNVDTSLSSTTQSHSPERTTPSKFGLVKHLKLLRIGQKAPKAKGFEVSRPRQIVIRPLQTVEDNLSQSDHLRD